MILLLLISCDRTLESWGEPWIPSLSLNTPPPAVLSTSVRRVEDYMLPAGIDPSAPVRSECLAGEDVRGWYQPTFAIVEVQRWGVMLNGAYTSSLNDGVLDAGYAQGQLLPELHDALVTMRTTGAGYAAGMPCWPDTPPRLLIQADATTSWSVVQRVVFTGWEAGFDDIDLLVDDPLARTGAETLQPRPPFQPGARSAPEPPHYLSEDEVSAGLAQLRQGYRLRPSADQCRDRLGVHRMGGATFLLPTALGAGQLDDLEPWLLPNDAEPEALDQALQDWVDEPARVDVQVAADDDLTWLEVVTLASSTSRALPGASLALVDDDGLPPSQTRLGVMPSAIYQSYGHQDWLSVIELSPPSVGLSLACGDGARTE